MLTLRLGMSGAEVLLAQHLLNSALTNTPGHRPLDPDGVFGPATERAVRLHQTVSGRRVPDGIVDLPMWRTLGVQFIVQHQTPLVPAPTPEAALGACLSMVCDPPPDGADGLAMAALRSNGRDDQPIHALADRLGLSARAVEPPCARQMLDALGAGPALLFGWTRHGRHVVAVSALWSRANLLDDGTVVRILDSLPVGRGSRSGSLYPSMTVQGTPFRPEWLLVRDGRQRGTG